MRDITKGDRVDFLIHNSSASDKPAAISFRRKDDMSISVVWGILGKVLQWNETFLHCDLS